MKNIKETAGKVLSESICRSVKVKVCSSRFLFVPRYHIIDIIKGKL
jgi:hypothetical protein